MLRLRISPLVPPFIVFVMLLTVGCSGGSDSAPPASPPTNGGPNSGSPPVQLGRFDAPVFAVIAMPDGTGDLMVGGSFTTYDGRPVRPVVRLRANGALDETFTVADTVLPAPAHVVTSLAAADDGTGDVYIGAMDHSQVSVGAPVAGRIWRVHRDGSRDAAFRPAEVTDTSAGRFALTINTLVPTDDGTGRVYAGGSFNHLNGTPVPAIVRLLPTGLLDPSFSTAGGGAERLAPAKDGSGDLYVVTYQAVDLLEYGSPNLYRLNANGSRDEAFETVTVLAGQRTGTIRCIEVLADGSGDVLIGGSFYLDPMGSGPPFLDPTAMRNVARINPDGTRDRASPRPPAEDQVMALATAVDGTNDWLLAVGTPPTMALTRVHSDGSSDTAFGPVAVMGWVRHLLPVADGSGDWYVGGDVTGYNGTPVGHLVRVRRDGGLR